jgi:hypothetical protein
MNIHMRLRHFLILLPLLAATSLRAQNGKMMWDFGFTYQFLSEESVFPASGPTPNVVVQPFYGLTGGLNYVLWHSNDKVSLLANPGALLSVRLGGGGVNIFTQAPTYLAFHAGAGSTPFNEQRVGIGAGVGVVPGYLYYKTFGFPSYQAGVAMVNPGAMADLTILGRSTVYKIRVNWSLTKSRWQDIDALQVRYSTFGIGVLYVF